MASLGRVLKVIVSPDRLSASVQPASSASEEELREALRSAGVVHGLMEDRISGVVSFLERAGGLPRPVVVAKGEPPVEGIPARLELALDLGLRSGLVDAESMRIDFRERGSVCNVTVGTLLAVWIPAKEGRPGMGVDGSALNPAALPAADATHGEGVRTEPHSMIPGGLALVAELDGVVRVNSRGLLEVSELVVIDGDVDLEVGNVDVNGSVQISGNVQAGFRVTARHDIRVGGSIEDAEISAGGRLEVGGGILGGGVRRVFAGEGIEATFIQNALVESGGDVVIGSDTRSEIRCSGSLLAEKGAGHLCGGDYWAGGGVRARELGSGKGAPTRVQVGRDPLLAREVAQATQRLRELEAELRKRESEPHAGSRESSESTTTSESAARILARAMLDSEQEVRALREKRSRLLGALDDAPLPTVSVESKVHSGVVLRIGSGERGFNQSCLGGLFYLDADEGEILSR